MTKPFLIIQLRKNNKIAKSELERILITTQLSLKDIVRVRAEKNGLPDFELKEYAGIIVGGSPFDITTPKNNKTEIQKIIEADFEVLLKKVVDRDFPFIGICSGNGLLGNHCGAKISKKYGESVGGVDIQVTKEGKNDPLLSGLPKKFRALVGHKEACESLPKNAVLLAKSETCPIEMFRIKNNVYATQFHPEADADELVKRIKTYKHHGYFPPEDADRLIDKIKREKIVVPQLILQRFAKRYKAT